MELNQTETNERAWRSISSTVSKDFHDELLKLAQAEGVKVGTLIRRAVEAYCSWQVQGIATSMKVAPEQLIRQSALLFQRVNTGKKENALRDRVMRLEIWMEKLFYQLTGRNDRLMMQMRVEVERRMKDFFKELAREEEELRQAIPREVPSGVPSVPTDSSPVPPTTAS